MVFRNWHLAAELTAFRPTRRADTVRRTPVEQRPLGSGQHLRVYDLSPGGAESA